MSSNPEIQSVPIETTVIPQPPNPIKQEENNSFVQYTPENIIEKLEQPAVTTPKVKQADDAVPPRAYLDKTVVPTLLEGMKLLATERPSDPLAYLGHFLLSRSSEKQQ